METAPCVSHVPYQDCLFYPQPGDIILCHKPIVYTDGTLGPLVKIYKDNFHFEVDREARTTFRKPHSQIPEIKKGDRILRLFKIYRTWEFVPSETHRLHIYYPGFANNWHWFTLNTAPSKHHITAVNNRRRFHFTHVVPSKIFTTLSMNEFVPEPGDIIIRAIAFPDMDWEQVKCAWCRNEEEDRKRENILMNFQNNSLKCVHKNEIQPPEECSPGSVCLNCFSERKELEEAFSFLKLPWKAQWEIQYWRDTLEIQHDDLLVRYAIDTKYDEGTFKKTHLQAELFSYAEEYQQWKYLGMDVAQFGPMPQFKDLVYRPQPGDIIISRCKNWGVSWKTNTNVGGFALFYKDPNYFGEKCMGQNLWFTPAHFKSSSVKDEKDVGKVPGASPRVVPKIHTDSWLIRLGTFDEYWDFHVNDRAEIFLMHPNGKTMSKNYTADSQHLGQTPNYRFDEKAHQIKETMEIEPNHWDLIVRRYEKTKEATLKNLEWERDPEFWMKDPMLWGKDIPPRYDKDVEIYTYWSGFVFEDKDLLVRPAFVLGDGILPGPDMYIPNYTQSEDRSGTPYGPQNAPILPISTYATVEVYQVGVVANQPPAFLLCGRDKFHFPTQSKYSEPEFEYADDDRNLWEKPKEKPQKGGKGERKQSKDETKGDEGQETKDGKEGGEGKGEGKAGNGKGHGGALSEHEIAEYDVWAEIEKARQNKEAKKMLRLATGDNVALP